MFFAWKYLDEVKKQMKKYFEHQDIIIDDCVQNMECSDESKKTRKRKTQGDEIATKKWKN